MLRPHISKTDRPIGSKGPPMGNGLLQIVAYVTRPMTSRDAKMVTFVSHYYYVIIF